MKKTANKKRINFRLPRSLAFRFSQEAIRKGVTKSQLLRDWVQDTETITLEKSKNSQLFVSFHFFVDSELLEFIDKTASEFGVKMSTFLRLTLHNNLKQNIYVKSSFSSTPAVHNFLEMWNNGQIGEISHALDTDIEKLTLQELFWYAKARVEFNNHDKALQAIDLAKGKLIVSDSNTNIFHRFQLLDVEISTNKRNFSKTIKILDSILNGDGVVDEIKGLAYYHIGTIAALKELTPKSPHMNYAKAMQYLNKKNHLYEITKMKVFSSLLNLREEKYEEADNLLSQANLMINNNPNKHLNGWVKSAIGRLNSLRANDVRQGNYSLNEAYKIHIENGFHKGVTENLGTLGFNKLFAHNYLDAKKLLEKALASETQFRKPSADGLTYSGILFIHSRDNYKDSIKRMFNIVRSKENVSHMTTKKYLYYSAKYLHGKDNKDRDEGKENLIRMSLTSNFSQIRSCAEKTLESKCLHPFAV